ncbi:schlafen family member 11-like [Monodelphis domestica]|nr:schlafen family member 11-like [Monodelphis domestica]
MELLARSLHVELPYPDVVINVGKITLGEKNRNKLTKVKKDEEREKIIIAACSLLNSGGGVIIMEMANDCTEKMDIEMGLDLENSLSDLIEPSPFHTYFETSLKEKFYYIFVRSWSSGISPENNSVKPRICSQSMNLYYRSATRTLKMSPSLVINFLKERKKRSCSSVESAPPQKVLKFIDPNIEDRDPVSLVFQRDRLEKGEVLPFSESMTVEFKQFATKKIVTYIKDIIPKYISAFANTEGGYLFIGVEDSSRKVEGALKENMSLDSLEDVIKQKIDRLPFVHLSPTCPALSVKYTIKFLEVYDKEELYSYVCAIKVEPFCCVVFSEKPVSWIVEDGCIKSLSIEDYTDKILDADPDLSFLAKQFDSQLSLDNCPPHSRPVYCKKTLDHKEELQKCLFPVSSEEIKYKPDSLCQELFSEHEGLEELINKEICKEKCSQGILIFSRSWAVDIGLQENPRVLCDALLIASDSFPILYTILREPPLYGEGYSIWENYCVYTARMLKQKLVNTGGYTEKVCIIPKILILNSGNEAVDLRSSDQLIYPKSYRVKFEEMTKLLQSLVIALLSFQSFLSDQIGYEILNLLTIEQYKVISKNLHKTPELFIHGFPGTGKTIIAMKIIEKIKNVFNCEKKEILFICENQPLKDFMRKKDICEAVTRKHFQTYIFNEVKHIIIDEAQNFRQEDGPWYKKAKAITQKPGQSPGTLWIFLDYFQTSHIEDNGLPDFNSQYPKEMLTKIVRNADPIARYIKENIEMIKSNPPFYIAPTSLKMLGEAHWSSGVQGFFELKKNLTRDQIVTYVAENCKKLFQKGFSSKNIAILVSTLKDIDYYEESLKQATKKIRGLRICSAPTAMEGDYIVLDSIRRFSGLQRTIVFGLNPVSVFPHLSLSLLVCLASRALTHLYILYEN